MSYDYTSKYEKVKKKIEEEYGTVHLCGNCKYTTKCTRNIIQIGDDAERKGVLMRKYAPFVSKFELQNFDGSHRQTGFVAVYECSKYEFEGA